MSEILLIDDDEILSKALTRYLQKEGFSVRACADGKEGLEQMERHTYDLVITDINMPYANGFEVMARIRADERYREIPIIAITSMSSESSITQCYRSGANDFIKKPLMPHELHIRIRKLLGSFV